MSRSDAKQVKPKSHKLNASLVREYNPIIKNLQTVIRNILPILDSDTETKNIFPEGTTNVTYKREESLRKHISRCFRKTQVSNYGK